MSPRKLFERELEELRQDVLQMGEWVEDGYSVLFDTLDKQDGETMKKVVRHDRAISDMQRNIESKCLSLLTRQTPVARDLRTVSAALKIVSDLERIGSHLSDMAELFTRMEYLPLAEVSGNFPTMIEETKKSVSRSVSAFVDLKMKQAEEVIDADDVIDDFFNQVKNDLVAGLKAENKAADIYVDALMVAKYLEKIGDHAVNIAKWEIFQETGVIDEVRLL